MLFRSIDHLISVGQNQFLAGVEGSETMGMAIASQDDFTKFIEHVFPGDVLLFKASRAEKLNEMVDSVVSYLKERENANEGNPNCWFSFHFAQLFVHANLN